MFCHWQLAAARTCFKKLPALKARAHSSRDEIAPSALVFSSSVILAAASYQWRRAFGASRLENAKHVLAPGYQWRRAFGANRLEDAKRVLAPGYRSCRAFGASHLEDVKHVRFTEAPLQDKMITMARSRVSAGLLMFRTQDGRLEVLLAHPGGPYFKNKDDGVWTVPKGEVAEGEDRLARARTEFKEELGIAIPTGELIELGETKQKGGKTVFAWAFRGDLPADFQLESNSFEMEWPPRSGKLERFPEIDRARFFRFEEARRKINCAQSVFLDRLIEQLNASKSKGTR